MFGHHPRGCQDTKSTHRSPKAPCAQTLQKSNLEEIKPSVLVHDKGTSKSCVRKLQQLEGLHRAFCWVLFPQQVPGTPRIYRNRVLPSLHLSSNSFLGEPRHFHQPTASSSFSKLSAVSSQVTDRGKRFPVALPSARHSRAELWLPTGIKTHSGFRRLLL